MLRQDPTRAVTPDRPTPAGEREARVTPQELFFDLVFVFAFTQVTGLMSADLTWGGLGHALLVLAALWWAWTLYAWLTNALEPEAIVGLGTLRRNGRDAARGPRRPRRVLRGRPALRRGYLVVRLIQLTLMASPPETTATRAARLCGSRPPPCSGPRCSSSPVLFEGPPRLVVWLVALTLDYAGAMFTQGHGLLRSPAHFDERHGLIVLIALGESVVSIGIGTAGLPLSPGLITGALLGVAVTAALWWAYFDIFPIGPRRALSSVQGAARVRLARDYYSYLHLPMIAGIVLFALGLKKTLEHFDTHLDPVAAVALCGGLGLYFLAHVGFRLRLTRQIGLGRPVTAAVLFALTPAALVVPALAALTLVTAVCCGLIVFDVIHYREERVRLREER